MRAFTSKGRRAAPCCDTRPASGCQGFFLSQSSINIRLNKQKGIYPETSRLLLFINQSTTKQFPLHYSSLHHRNKRKTPAQKCPTLCSLTDWSPPSSSVHGLSQEEYCSEQPFLSPGDPPCPGVDPRSLSSGVSCITTSTLSNLYVSLSGHTFLKSSPLNIIMNSWPFTDSACLNETFIAIIIFYCYDYMWVPPYDHCSDHLQEHPCLCRSRVAVSGIHLPCKGSSFL